MWEHDSLTSSWTWQTNNSLGTLFSMPRRSSTSSKGRTVSGYRLMLQTLTHWYDPWSNCFSLNALTRHQKAHHELITKGLWITDCDSRVWMCWTIHEHYVKKNRTHYFASVSLILIRHGSTSFFAYAAMEMRMARNWHSYKLLFKVIVSILLSVFCKQWYHDLLFAVNKARSKKRAKSTIAAKKALVKFQQLVESNSQVFLCLLFSSELHLLTDISSSDKFWIHSGRTSTARHWARPRDIRTNCTFDDCRSIRLKFEMLATIWWVRQSIVHGIEGAWDRYKQAEASRRSEWNKCSYEHKDWYAVLRAELVGTEPGNINESRLQKAVYAKQDRHRDSKY